MIFYFKYKYIYVKFLYNNKIFHKIINYDTKFYFLKYIYFFIFTIKKNKINDHLFTYVFDT